MTKRVLSLILSVLLLVSSTVPAFADVEEIAGEAVQDAEVFNDIPEEELFTIEEVEPEASEPEVSEPEVNEPEVNEPEVNEPEVNETEVS